MTDSTPADPIPDSPAFPDVAAIDTVTCVGAGTIGGGWAAYFLAQGFRVKIWDPAPDAGDKFTRLLDAAWPAMAELDMVEGADRTAWSIHTDLAEAITGTGFVQESAPEDLALKRGLLAQIDGLCPPNIVISSSTSGYSMTEMATEAAHPERLVVGHPFNPPYLIPLVEVVGGQSTSAAAVDWAADFFTHIGKSVIRMDREVPASSPTVCRRRSGGRPCTWSPRVRPRSNRSTARSPTAPDCGGRSRDRCSRSTSPAARAEWLICSTTSDPR